MSRVIVITGCFPKYDRAGFKTGEYEEGVSHGVEEGSMRTIILPQVRYPSELGAKYDDGLGEWVIE